MARARFTVGRASRMPRGQEAFDEIGTTRGLIGQLMKQLTAQVGTSIPARIPTSGRLMVGRRDDDRHAEADFALARGLAGYVRAVACMLHVGREATDYEVSDTATAYVALSPHSSVHPGRDLMLVPNGGVGHWLSRPLLWSHQSCWPISARPWSRNRRR